MGDWLPTSRIGRLAMCTDWLDVLVTGGKAQIWNVPQSRITDMEAAKLDAQNALIVSQNEMTRTKVANAQCTAAFTVLKKLMRDTKHRYYISPPLTDADFVSLGLLVHDGIPTNVPRPAGFPNGSTSSPGPGVIVVHCFPMAGQPPLDLRSGYGYRIYWGVYPPGGATIEMATGFKRELMRIPTSGDELPHSQWTRRRNETFDFHGDSGKTVFFCIRYENSKGEFGPWGPIFFAVIP